MVKALTAVGIALVLLIGGLALVVVLTRDPNRISVDNDLAERITKAIALSEGQGEDVDLGLQARFRWDHVLIVARGIEPAAIGRRLGRTWNGVGGLETGERFVFLDHGKIVRYADYRGYGTFEGFPRFALLPRSRAVLRVRDLTVRPAPQAAASGRLR